MVYFDKHTPKCNIVTDVEWLERQVNVLLLTPSDMRRGRIIGYAVYV